MNLQGSICACDRLRYRLLMKNNYRAYARYCMKYAQVAAKTHTKGQQTLGRVDLCCIKFIQQYIGNHIIINASDTILA
jgi:hypothetical protein